MSQDGPDGSGDFRLDAQLDAREEDQVPVDDAGRGAVMQRGQLLEEAVHQLFGEDRQFLLREAALNAQLVRGKEELDHLLGCCPVAADDEPV